LCWKHLKQSIIWYIDIPFNGPSEMTLRLTRREFTLPTTSFRPISRLNLLCNAGYAYMQCKINLPPPFVGTSDIISGVLSIRFLAHLSTKCSGWAIVTGLCPSSVIVRRPSCVVRKLFYLNIFSSETTCWISTKLHRNDPWVVPYQSCSNGSDWLHK